MGCGVSSAMAGVQNAFPDLFQKIGETTQQLAKTDYANPEQELKKLNKLEKSTAGLAKDAEKIPNDQISKLCTKLVENLKTAIMTKRADTEMFKPKLEDLLKQSKKVVSKS